MSRYGASPLALPAFRGATRRLILLNLAAFFLLLLVLYIPPVLRLLMEAGEIPGAWPLLGFHPASYLHGRIWQPFTYSLIHTAIWGTFFELLSLWLR